MMRKKRASGPDRFHYERTLDLHGFTVEDAIARIDQEICGIVRPRNLMIIHGRGDGILRSNIRKFLGRHPLIARTEGGENLNIPGGDGVTIIYTRS